jgi:hypothetical protein
MEAAAARKRSQPEKANGVPAVGKRSRGEFVVTAPTPTISNLPPMCPSRCEMFTHFDS